MIIPLRHLITGLALTGTLSASQLAFAQELPPPAAPKATSKTPDNPKAALDKPAPQPGNDQTVDEPTQPSSGPLPGDQTPGDQTPVEPTPAPVVPIPTPTPKPAPVNKASVGGASIVKLTDAQAVRFLARSFAFKFRAPITLSDGVQTYTLTRGELGATIPWPALIHQARQKRADVPIHFVVDTTQARRAMRRLAARIDREPQPASLDVANGSAVLRGGDGVDMSVSGSVQRVQQALEATPPRQSIDLVVARRAAAGGASEATLRPFRYMLAEFETPYDASVRGRTNNLRMAASRVNGTIVPDGAVFSTNQTIGPRNAEAGWQEAKMFLNGQVVTGVGSGICQCSSTIYNAALLAGLPILERYPHSFRVTYAPASRDAAIYWGQKDFKFRNDTGGSLYVQTFLTNNLFHVRLYGTRLVDRKVTIEARTLSRRNGTTSEAYRTISDSNGTRTERLSRDYYRPHP